MAEMVKERDKKKSTAGNFTSSMAGFYSVKITDAQFKKFSNLIYKKVGIFLKPEKKELLISRLGRRLRSLNFTSFKDYYEYVVDDTTGKELINLIDNVSTNFTSFFREQAHFDFLFSTALPDLFKARENGRDELLVWSAACSSGEEPYTLGMVLEEYILDNPGRRYRIMASDISTRVLAQAKKGVYARERLEKVPVDILKRYFQKGVGRSAGYVKVKEELRRLVTFMRLNLMDDFQWECPIDIIFCRNVMIYFDKSTQQKLIDKFYRCLAPGGFLFIGHSESLAGLKHDFKQVLAACYQK